MSNGRRYTEDRKLNMKKVVGVIIAIVVLIMVVISIKKLLDPRQEESISATTFYFSAYQNGKWGVINSAGKEIIPFDNEEMVIVPDKEKDVFITTTDVDVEKGTYKTKVFNKKQEEIFKDYDLVETIDNFSSSNAIWYEENVLKVKKDGKYGLINFAGAKILDIKYDDIYSLKGTKNSLIIVSDGKLGLASNVGDIIVPVEYKAIRAAGDDYSKGYIVVNQEDKQGLISTDKKAVLDAIYDEIKTVSGNGMYVVNEDGKLKIINSEKNVVLDSDFDDCVQIVGENLVLKRGDNVGVLNTLKEEKIPFEYQDIKCIGDFFIAKKDGKYGVIDGAGETKVEFKYEYMKQRKDADFIEADKDSTQTDIYDKELNLKLTGIVSSVNTEKGYIQIRIDNEQKYYNFKFEEKEEKDFYPNRTLFLSKKDGKYGYKNEKGELVVDYTYDDAKEQNEYGFCSVKKGNVWGALNSVGNVALKPCVNMDNNLIIDFIGTWHLAEDLNLYYYEK